MPDLLKEARTEAERYYGSREYAEYVRQLISLLKERSDDLKDLNLALDLEGVLASTDLPESLGYPREERLRRPFAQEALDLLDYYAKSLIVWTGAYGGVEKEIAESSGLILPESVEMIHRKKYINRLVRYNNGNVGTTLCQIESGEIVLPPDASEETRRHIEDYSVKVPKALSVDYLFDDHAEKHKASCRAIGFPDEARKIIEVPAFSLASVDEIKRHHKDLGLLESFRRAFREVI